MQLVDAAAVHSLLSFPELVAALAEAHRGPEPLVERAKLDRPGGGETPDTFLVLPAWQPGRAFGAKLVTVLPLNPARPHGLPAVQASYVLFDGADGRPLAAIDGTALTYRKTAADSALGARFLAREDAGVLLVCGAGALAPYLVHAHRAVRPSLSAVLVWNRTADKAERLAATLRAEGIDAEAATALEPAVRRADIVTCATASTTPFIEGAWLQPGCHLDLVGAFTPDMRECDDAAVLKASLYVDSRWFAIHQPGDLADPIRRGVIEPSAIRADLFALCRGEAEGRTAPHEVTLFKNGGGAHLDLFCAMHLMNRFNDRG